MSNNEIAIAVVAVLAVILVIVYFVSEYRDMKKTLAEIDKYNKSCRELDRHFATVPKD